MVARALHDGRRAAVAHREALAGPAAGEQAAAGGAVEDRVAQDDVLVGGEAGLGGWHDVDLAAAEPLGDVVVRLALQDQPHAVGGPGTEALAALP